MPEATGKDYARLAALFVEDAYGCWHWIGSADDDGYARAWYHGRNWHAARLFWLLAGRDLPPGYEIDHRCHNRRCVNPDHCRKALDWENRQRAIECRRLGLPFIMESRAEIGL